MVVPLEALAPADASLQSGEAGQWLLAGAWTRQGIADLARHMPPPPAADGAVVVDGSALQAFDSAGAWLLRQWLGAAAAQAQWQAWPPDWQALMQLAASSNVTPPAAADRGGLMRRVGLATLRGLDQARALLTFIGEAALSAAAVAARPRQLRWRSVLHHVQIGGFDALPIVLLMSFLLGVVVAYQGAGQLRHYGANIFVVELVGYAMLREFAPLMTAIIIAGRSGSSYAAQIGTMVVTEEVDAMRTLGIDPLQQLVLPRLLALAIALPLLTVAADVAGVFGGMVMARTQLDVGFPEFLDRFGRELRGSHLLVGLGKSLVFAAVIAVVGCFQGFRTRASADSVGRQTTLAVVQAIFLVIVVDAAFSVLFSRLDL
jgi:phospholipid/cholesterol/gamma-HCH transport system permease protein